MKLYLIAGHGAGDPGACGNGYTEAERVRALCSKIKEFGGDNVVYLDPNRDWYADNGISSLNISSSDCLLECHMDAGVSSARGGHVIIWGEYEPDKYDNNLAEMITGILPGRAQGIVKRTDLANAKRAVQHVPEINYRLCEFGFITNTTDVNIFNTNIELIAKRVLACFGLSSAANSVTKETQTTSTAAKTTTSAANIIDSASAFDKSLAKAYTCTDNLNMRTGAGTNKTIICTLPKGTKATCYGYYTKINNVKWLCVTATFNNKNYTGYCSSDYLKNDVGYVNTVHNLCTICWTKYCANALFRVQKT